MKPAAYLLLAVIPLISLVSFGAQAVNRQRAEPDPHAFDAGVKAYLAQKGHVCLAKRNWPIDVAPDEERMKQRDAVQMPVLKKLGLVSETRVVAHFDKGKNTGEVVVRRFALTREGKKYLLSQNQAAPAGDGRKADFCVATVALDKVTGWSAPSQGPRPETTVRYTYRVKAAPWLKDKDAQRVFPMVARLLAGERSFELQERFVRTDKGWRAVDLM